MNILVSAVNEFKKTSGKVADMAKSAALATSLAVMSLPVSADPNATLNSGNMNISQTVSKAINLVVGFVIAGGIVNIVLGVRNLAAGVSDEGGGQDQQKISKGKGQLFSGIIMAGGMAIVRLLLGDPATLLSGYF